MLVAVGVLTVMVIVLGMQRNESSRSILALEQKMQAESYSIDSRIMKKTTASASMIRAELNSTASMMRTEMNVIKQWLKAHLKRMQDSISKQSRDSTAASASVMTAELSSTASMMRTEMNVTKQRLKAQLKRMQDSISRQARVQPDNEQAPTQIVNSIMTHMKPQVAAQVLTNAAATLKAAAARTSNGATGLHARTLDLKQKLRESKEAPLLPPSTAALKETGTQRVSPSDASSAAAAAAFAAGMSAENMAEKAAVVAGAAAGASMKGVEATTAATAKAAASPLVISVGQCCMQKDGLVDVATGDVTPLSACTVKQLLPYPCSEYELLGVHFVHGGTCVKDSEPQSQSTKANCIANAHLPTFYIGTQSHVQKMNPSLLRVVWFASHLQMAHIPSIPGIPGVSNIVIISAPSCI